MSRNNGYSSIGESPESITSSTLSPSTSTSYYQQTAASDPVDANAATAYAMDVEDLLYPEDSLFSKKRSNKADKDHLTRTLNGLRGMFVAGVALSLVVIVAWWSLSDYGSSSSSLASGPSPTGGEAARIAHPIHLKGAGESLHSFNEVEGDISDNTPVYRQVFHDSGNDDERDSSCVTCPHLITTACADPSTGPVLGGIDFVATYNSYNSTAHTLGHNQTVAPLGDAAYSLSYGVSAIDPSKMYTFYFINQTNKDAFIENPDKYIPQWGGFCSWGMAWEYCPKYPWSASCLGPSGNAYMWSMYEDKLFFFLRKSAFILFDENYSKAIPRGVKRWESWFGRAMQEGQYVLDTGCYKHQYF